jgi:regulator of replication initiation timing
MIEMTVNDLLAKIGALTLEVDALRAENVQLRERAEKPEPKPEEAPRP